MSAILHRYNVTLETFCSSEEEARKLAGEKVREVAY